MKTKRSLVSLLTEASEWNQADIDGFDDISPTLTMLENRQKILKKALKIAKSLEATPPDLRVEDVRALSLVEKQALGGKLTDSELAELSRYNE